MRRSARAWFVLGIVAAILVLPAAASAHPLGNFTINTSVGIVLLPGSVRVDYVLDMAEIPTVQAMPELDADGDGTVTGAEGSAWAAERAAELLPGLALSVDGEPVALAVSSTGVELLPGQAGLDTLRLEATFSGAVPEEGDLVFRDSSSRGHVGWHEVTAIGSQGVAIDGSTVPTTSPSDGLRSYPTDLLSTPLDVREAALAFAPGAGTPAAPEGGQPRSTARPGVAGGAFADLVDRNGPLMVLALGVAFGFGALHALGPGHGKTLMVAYLVGAGGRTRQALIVGAAVAAMHTASVLGLGLIILAATEVFAPERVYPWLGLTSGLIALGLGAGLLFVRLRAQGTRAHDHGSDPSRHRHHHGSGPDEGHGRDRSHGRLLSRGGLVALAAAGGILPSPTALVVLLASIAVHRVGYGLALMGAFSLGLAAAIAVVAALALRARDVVARRMSSRVGRLMPIASAGAMAGLGLLLTARTFLSL